MTLANLAATVGGAMEVLGARRLDFWSQGERTLKAACAAAGLPLDGIVTELEAAASAPPPKDWSQVPIEALIDHLIVEHAGPLRVLLDQAQVSAEHLLGIHDGPSLPLRQSLVTLIAQLRDDWHAHLSKEELILFPAIVKRNKASPDAKLQVILGEHRETAGEMERLDLVIGSLPEHLMRRPAGVRFVADVRGLIQAIEEHMHLENNILFPRVRAEVGAKG